MYDCWALRPAPPIDEINAYIGNTIAGRFAPAPPIGGTEAGSPKPPPASDVCRMIVAPVDASGVPKHVCCCLLESARKHVRQALGKRMHQIGVPRGVAPGRLSITHKSWNTM